MQRRRFMPTYKHCAGCGRGYNQQAWQTESFCGSCSEPLKTGLRRDEPEEIHPYPDRDAPPNLRGGMASRLITNPLGAPLAMLFDFLKIFFISIPHLYRKLISVTSAAWAIPGCI
jgi:hypothetical protein